MKHSARLITLTLSAMLTGLAACSSSTQLDSHSAGSHPHSDHDHADQTQASAMAQDKVAMAEGAAHDHALLEIEEGQPVPTVNLVVHPDARQGWNLEIQVSNFRFAPERVNQASNTTEGHAHLYIDGQKVTRLYGPWFYLESLPPGRHTLTVGLNANGHESLAQSGQPIQHTVMIDVPTP